MTPYIIIFLVITAYFLNSIEEKEFRPITLGVIMIGLGLFVACADMMGGYDRYVYGDLFDRLSMDMRRGYSIFDNLIFVLYPKEPGYIAINVLIGFLTCNRYIFIFIFTMVVYVLILISMLKYTNRSPIVVILFLGLWFYFSFTYLRQVMAVSISWLAIEYAIKRKPWPFFTIILLAMSFHNAAILLAPIYFIPIKKANIPVVLLVMGICLYLGTTALPDRIFGTFGEITEDVQRAEKYMSETDTSGFRWEYLLESVVFLTLILPKYKHFDENNKGQIMMLNLALIFCALLLLFINSENGGRIFWFFMIGLFSTLSYLVTRERRFNLYGLSVILLCAVLFIRIQFAWGSLIRPYKSMFTNGHRDVDYIYRHYEYDKLYDQDHFYKL